jgi:hypothetical protein
MAEEFGFRMLDARRSIDEIQQELRRQISAFLPFTPAPSSGPSTPPPKG